MKERLPFIGAESIADCLSYTELISSMRLALKQGHSLPERMHYEIGKHWSIDARLLLMLAWRDDFYLGFKIVTLYPDNVSRGLPNLSGVYALFNGRTGEPLALMDAAELTAYRTAAASMLAAQCLVARPAENVLVIGAGNLSRYYINAYAEIMSPKSISLWSRDISKAEKVIESMQLTGVDLRVASNLESAAGEADIISTITSSMQPVLFGAWCKPGSHIDLVGGYRPDMREADDELIRRALIFVDTYEGVLKEAGDITEPLERGIISRIDIKADLAELLAGCLPDSTNDKDLTVFKSVGAAFEDLAAAVLVFEKTNQRDSRPKARPPVHCQ
ncbi:MAG: ornithine cyclodeaminase family protein [Xanthomonadales bacterium]|nr:ornithine cyclodeaminase family protein [Xanthomonadales bacterium]